MILQPFILPPSTHIYVRLGLFFFFLAKILFPCKYRRWKSTSPDSKWHWEQKGGTLLGISPRGLKIYANTKMFIRALLTVAKKWELNWWVDKQNVVYPYNTMLFGHIKEWSTDTCYNMDEPWTHNAKWKKPDAKGPILYDSIYIKHPNRQIHRQKVNCWLPRVGEFGRKMESNC